MGEHMTTVEVRCAYFIVIRYHKCITDICILLTVIHPFEATRDVMVTV